MLWFGPILIASALNCASAGGDPVNNSDPSGMATVGICVSGNLMLGPIALSAGDCLTRTIDSSGEDDIGITGTIGGAVGLGVGAGVSFYYQVSNATNLEELGKGFFFTTLSAEVAVGPTATVFWNSLPTLATSAITSGGKPGIIGIDVGIAIGAGVEAGLGYSYTSVMQFNGTISANIARGVWDTFNPELALGVLLTRARRDVKIAQQASSPSNTGC